MGEYFIDFVYVSDNFEQFGGVLIFGGKINYFERFPYNFPFKFSFEIFVFYEV